jgi:predicted membrane protein
MFFFSLFFYFFVLLSFFLFLFFLPYGLRLMRDALANEVFARRANSSKTSLNPSRINLNGDGYTWVAKQCFKRLQLVLRARAVARSL